LTFCANRLEPSASILMSALPPIADIGRRIYVGIWLPVSPRPSKFTYPTAGFSGESHQ
jgi:hypothetical protein